MKKVKFIKDAEYSPNGIDVVSCKAGDISEVNSFVYKSWKEKGIIEDFKESKPALSEEELELKRLEEEAEALKLATEKTAKEEAEAEQARLKAEQEAGDVAQAKKAEDEKIKGFGVKEIKKLLDAKAIEYKSSANKTELLSLLGIEV